MTARRPPAWSCGAMATLAIVFAGCSAGEPVGQSTDRATTDESTVAPADRTEPGGTDGVDDDLDDTTDPSVTAISNGGTDESAETARCAADADGAGSITVWHTLTGVVTDVIDERVARYQAATGVAIELVALDSGYDGVVEALRSAEPSELPDLLLANEQAVRLFADSGRFVPIVDCTGGTTPPHLAELLPIVERTYTVDGTMWAAPYNVSAPVMFFDGRRWERAGLDPASPPETPDELEAAIRQLVDSGAATTGAVLYDRSGGWLLEQGAAQHGHLLLVPDNGHDRVAITEVDLVTDWAVDLLARMQTLRAEGYVHWSGLNAGGSDDLAQLIHPTEPSGLTFNTSALLGNIIDLQREAVIPDVEIGVAPLPFGGVGSTIGGGAWWLYDSGDPERIGAAWRFAEWLTQPEAIAELAAATGYVPTTPAAVEHPTLVRAWEEHPVLRVAYDQVVATDDSNAGAGIQVGPFSEVFRNLELSAMWTIERGTDPRSELARHAAVIEDVLAAYEAAYEDDD